MHSDNPFNVLERLTQLLQLHDNISFYHLAKQSGIARATIQRWFDKNKYPPIDKLETICHVLNITLAEFFYEGKDTGTDGEMVTGLHLNKKHIYKLMAYLIDSASDLAPLPL